MIVEALRRPELAFTHRAVSGWLNGTRNPSLEHRRLLAPILGVSFDELNYGCDSPFDDELAAAALKRVIVRVFGKDRTFEYPMTVSTRVKLEQPAVYQHWADMFSPWPARLVRHFGRMKHDLFGWAPGLSEAASTESAGALVKLDAHRPKLEPAGTVDPRTWFVYLPKGRLAVGKAVREDHRSISITLTPTGTVESYRASRIDVVGSIAGRPLLEVIAWERKGAIS